MKMIFSKEKFKQHCKATNFPMNFYGSDWIEKTDRKKAIFIEGKEAGTCEGFVVLKEWCEPVDENTAEQMFDALGYEKEIRGNYVDYCKIVINEFEDIGLWRSDRRIVIFDTKKKTVETYDSGVEDCIAVDGELLKAIVKQFDEFGW